MTNRRRALQHYQQAIRALSDGQYSDLTDCERQALLQVLREERGRLLHEVVANEPETRSLSAPRSPD
jgi:hypothetical protein